MYELETLLVAGLTGTATIILAAFAIIQSYSAKTQADAAKIQADAAKIQTDLLKKEFETAHRAWIGMGEKGFELKNSPSLWCFYKNYGKMPANDLQERWNITNTKPGRELMKSDSTNVIEKSVNLPSQERGFIMNMDKPIVKDSLAKKTELYFWAFLDYKYGETGHGEYGVIAHYRYDNNSLEIIDEWAV